MARPLKSFLTGLTLLAGLSTQLFDAPSAHAHQQPSGCSGSGLGIILFTDSLDVHVGDTLTYSVTILNGTGVGPIVCDATGIQASIVTPDGVLHPIPLTRTTLANGQSDFYPNVMTYVVRSQDILPDGSVRATAYDTGTIHQNDTDSQGGGNQGVNTEVSMPCIRVTAQCVGGVGENGLITFTGTVTNCGNNVLGGVTVSNTVDGIQYPVFSITNLARGQVASFSGSWIPQNPCAPSTATLVAQGRDDFTRSPRTVTSTATTTCSESLSPSIVVSKFCPAPVSPGQPLVYSGTVSNSGNVTLTNVIVLNSRPAANTEVFTLATLAPGQVAAFVGSYLAPTNCSVTDTLTARANSRCGALVTDSVVTTCDLLSTPQMELTVDCPASPVLPGGSLVYSGTIRNSGDVTLTNVAIVSDRPASNTSIFTVSRLLPGAITNFTRSYTVPVGACEVTTTFRGVARDLCTLTGITNFTTTTCNVTTAPGIDVTLNCPGTQATAGGPITYTGTVRNSGNVTLNNVFIVNDKPFPNTVYGPVSLAPGVVSNFTYTFTVPLGACSVNSAVTATGNDTCSGALVQDTAAANCALRTTPSLILTQTCPEIPAVPGGTLTFSGTVSNAGNVVITNIVVLNNLSGATPVFTLALLDPGAVAVYSGTYLAPTNCSVTSVSTVTGRSVCGVATTNSVSLNCGILTTPQVEVTVNCPAGPILPGGSLTYNGTIRNSGNITLTNVAVLSDRPAANTTVFTVARLVPGAITNFSRTYTVPVDTCAMITAFAGVGQDVCTLAAVTNTTVAVCSVTTAPGVAVTLSCPVSAPVPGSLITYTGTVRNSGNVTLNNVFVVNSQPTANTPVIGPITLAPGVISNFTASFVTPLDACSVSSTVLAAGIDICSGVTVTNGASTTCPLLTTPSLVLSQFCPQVPAVPGGLLTYSGTVSNAGNITITNVVILNSLSGASPIFTAATLSPGAVAVYSGSYLAPTNCSVTSVSSVTGRSLCGVTAAASVSSTCNILTTPQVEIAVNCPQGPIVPGGSLTYSGTIRNAGNVTLTNVIVLSDRPGTNTTVFTAVRLLPGAITNFSRTYTVPVDTCAMITAFSGVAQDACSLLAVTNSTVTVCPVTTAPAIAVTLACPPGTTPAGSLITYSGTVRNAGNVTLNNVFVVNSQPTANTPVIGPLTLAPGAVSSFTTSFVTPVNVCSVSSTVLATGNDLCSGAAVTNSASTLCPLLTTPGLTITQSCPLTPAVPGGLLTFTGTVSNTGDVTITNIVVLNNLSGATPVFTLASLAPGASASYSGSFTAPSGCSVTSVSTVSGRSLCGVSTGNTVSSTCPILTAPAIVVRQTCPITPVLQGSTLTYSGTVSNAGNITLTNVVVTSDRPASNTVIFTAAALAPGASASFTGSYLVPSNCCVVAGTLVGRGQACLGVTVSDTVTRTCTVFTSPALVVTKTCPPGVLRPGDLLTYTGTVRNTGNITLIDVTVANNQPGSVSPLLGPIILAPGESYEYTASYIVPPDFCGTDTVTATGLNVCTFQSVNSSITTTCPVVTTPRITVTKNCPLLPTPRGGLYTYTGTVGNAGNVTLDNVYVVNSQPSNNTPVIGPLTLAPGQVVLFTNSYIAPHCCCLIIDTLTARGQSRCTASNVVATATTVCPLLTTPAIALVQSCPAQPLAVGSTYQFSGYVTNSGDGLLTNVVVFAPGGSNVLLGPIELAPGEIEFYTGSALVPSNSCGISVTVLARDACSGNEVANVTTCPVNATALLAITQSCPPGPVVAGATVAFSGAVTNTGSLTLTNVIVFSSQVGGTPVLGPISLAPGAVSLYSGTYVAQTGSNPSTNTVIVTNSTVVIVDGATNIVLTFVTNSIVSFTPANTVTVFGMDLCLSGTVSAAADCLGPVVPQTPVPLAGRPVLTGGTYRLAFATEVGKSYTVQFKNSLTDPVWLDLQVVVGTGGEVAVTDPAAGLQPSRFYRIVSTPL